MQANPSVCLMYQKLGRRIAQESTTVVANGKNLCTVNASITTIKHYMIVDKKVSEEASGK